MASGKLLQESSTSLSHLGILNDQAQSLYNISTPSSRHASRKIIEMLRWSSKIREWERHEEPTDGSLQGSSSADVELGIL